MVEVTTGNEINSEPPGSPSSMISIPLGEQQTTGVRTWTKIRSLDGQYWSYTAAVLTSMCLALAILFFERGFLQGREDSLLSSEIDDLGLAEKRVFRSFLLLLFAVLDAVFAFLLLVPNLRNISLSTSKLHQWLFGALAGFVLANAAAIFNTISAVRAFKFIRREDHFVSPAAHYFILICFWISMVTMDVLFVRVIFMPTMEADEQRKGWALLRLKRDKILAMGRKETGDETMMKKIARISSSVFDAFATFILKCVMRIFRIFQKTSHGNRERIDRARQRTYSLSDTILDCGDAIRKNVLVRSFLWAWHRFFKFLSKDLGFVWKPIAEFAENARSLGGTADAKWSHRMFHKPVKGYDATKTFFVTLRPRVERHFQNFWDGIKEDETYMHSSWVKAAVISSIILLIYFGLILMAHFHGFLDDIYLPHRDCVEENPKVADFFLRIAGFSGPLRNDSLGMGAGDICPADLESSSKAFDTLNTGGSGGSLIRALETSRDGPAQFLGQLMERSRNAPEEDIPFQCSKGNREGNPCLILSAINLFEELREEQEVESPSDVFASSFMGEFMYVTDAFLQELNWASWVGFIIGLITGIYSLLSILAQYKRFSLAIRSGLFEDLPLDERVGYTGKRDENVKRMESIVQDRRWSQIVQRYPMSFSAFFFGMLVSTAILQLVVFGTLVSSLFGLIAILFNSQVFDILKPFLAFLLTFLLTWLLNNFIAMQFIGEGLLVTRYYVIHEMAFLFFLLVYTAIHLVLGIFFALLRLVWLLIATFATINRLDKNLYSVWQDRDIGHKSFMAMVLMHHAFESNNEEKQQAWSNLLSNVLLQQQNSRQNAAEVETPLGTISEDLAGISIVEAVTRGSSREAAIPSRPSRGELGSVAPVPNASSQRKGPRESGQNVDRTEGGQEASGSRKDGQQTSDLAEDEPKTEQGDVPPTQTDNTQDERKD